MHRRTLSLAELIQAIPDVRVMGDPSTTISGMTYDSREVEPGDLFVALRGGYTDGHRYIGQAVERGATAAAVDRQFDIDQRPQDVPLLIASDTRRALADLAVRFFDEPSRELSVVGITGTDGKTTTSFMLHYLLARCGLSPGMITTVAVRVPGKPDRSAERQTTPESLKVQAMLREMGDAGAKSAVLETTSHALVTHRVDGCLFDVGIVTNVTSDHLDFHGDVQSYRAAKGDLLRRVGDARQEGKPGIAILNADDEGARSLKQFASNCDIWWYGVGLNNDLALSATDVVAEPDAILFSLSYEGESRDVQLPVAGRWNVHNALAAASGALALGAEFDVVVEALHSVPAVPGRMELVRLGQPFAVVIDYAHTPASLRGVLDELRSTCSGRLMVLLGSAGERDTSKRPELGRVAAELADFSVFTSEDPRYENPDEIIQAIAAGAQHVGARRGIDFVCIEDRRAAIFELLSRAKPGDCIVCAGKGHERSMIYEQEHRPWNEREVVSQTLQSLGYVATSGESIE